MKNLVIDEGMSIDRSASILCRLVAWASVTALIVGSPAMDASDATTLMTRASVTVDPSLFQWSGPIGSSATIQPYGVTEGTWRHAVREAEIALRILRVFKVEIGSRELDEYLNAVDGVLGGMPERPRVDDARRFALGLGLARTSFITDAATIRVWSRLTRAIDPEAQRLRVPERFVRRVLLEEESPIGWTRADARVDRAVRDFLTPDANRPTAAS